jgi:flagellar basal-body rod protein FlgB
MHINFLTFYQGVMDVRAQRAALIADNVANADTPNYKAVDVDFDAALGAALGGGDDTTAQYRANATVGLNGNDVALDAERVELAANGEQMTGAAEFLRQSTSDLITAVHPNPSGI